MSYQSWYSEFPEALYPVIKNNSNSEPLGHYCDTVVSGRHFMADKSAFIVGVCRNVAPNLYRFFSRVSRIASMFKMCHVFLYENDSTDETKRILQEEVRFFQRHNVTFHILSENFDCPTLEQNKSYIRRKYMASARNKYLEYIQSSRLCYDYTIVLDVDIIGGYSYEGIAHSFGIIASDPLHSDTPKSKVYTSNGIIYQDNQRLFYDTWAFRFLDKSKDEKYDDKMKNILVYHRGEPRVEVESNFGGLAIYETEALKHTNLIYTDEDCDHVTLHKQLRERGHKIYLNPSQIVLYSPHQYC